MPSPSKPNLQSLLKKLSLLEGYRHGVGATEKMIKRAERELCVERFPEAFSAFLSTVGWVATAGDFHFAGLGPDVPFELDLVKMTKTRLWKRDEDYNPDGPFKGTVNLTGAAGSYPALMDLRPGAEYYGKVLYRTDEGIYSVDQSYMAWLEWRIDKALSIQNDPAERAKHEAHNKNVSYLFSINSDTIPILERISKVESSIATETDRNRLIEAFIVRQELWGMMVATGKATRVPRGVTVFKGEDLRDDSEEDNEQNSQDKTFENIYDLVIQRLLAEEINDESGIDR